MVVQSVWLLLAAGGGRRVGGFLWRSARTPTKKCLYERGGMRHRRFQRKFPLLGQRLQHCHLTFVLVASPNGESSLLTDRTLFLMSLSLLTSLLPLLGRWLF